MAALAIKWGEGNGGRADDPARPTLTRSCQLRYRDIPPLENTLNSTPYGFGVITCGS